MEGMNDEAPDQGVDAAVSQADGSGDDPSALEGNADLERARQEVATLNDRHLRLAAEFDNYRKRTERERGESWARSQAELASSLLDALDDLGRVAHIDASAATVPSLLDGVQLVEKKLQRALTSAGLESIDPAGERFDPASMEALMMVEAETPEQDDVVAGVLQKGYRFKGQLLRPARVQVSKYHG
jgi:molecular chaperone GrpE